MYSKTDVAVSVRLLRALSDVAVTAPDAEYRRILVDLGRRVVAGCATRLEEHEMTYLRARLAELEGVVLSAAPEM
jgi:hypothetical protein